MSAKSEDKNDLIWAGAADPQWTNTGGLVLLNGEEIEKVFSEKDGFSYKNIRAIDQDINGNLIVGGNGGFSIFDGEKFETFTQYDGIPFGMVSSILVEGTNIWLGTADGVALYNGKKFRVYTQDDGLVHQWVHCIKKGPKGNIWIGTAGGISIFNGTQFENIWAIDGLSNHNVNDIYFNDSGDAIIATQGGAFKYNGLTFVRLDPKMAGHDFSLSQVNQVNRSSDGILWFNDWNGAGVVKYDPRSIVNTTEADSFPKSGIFDIKVDKNRNLWFATAGHGLIQMSKNKIVKQLKMKDGLRSNSIFAVDIDLDTKKFVKAKLDDLNLTAMETFILLWFNTIAAQHVKLHAMANWGINTVDALASRCSTCGRSCMSE